MFLKFVAFVWLDTDPNVMINVILFSILPSEILPFLKVSEYDPQSPTAPRERATEHL